MGESCPTCGLPIIAVDVVINCGGSYDDTAGGHADRHTLVVEAAERAIEGGRR